MDAAKGWELLRQTFGQASGLYQWARPDYRDELYAALIPLAGLRPETDSLCEVGTGPGKATLPLARHGSRITCVELGAALADEARRNLAARPHGQLRRHWGAVLHVACKV